ncbi:hypothetical protein ABENE_05885 [Asticcacaulis benevestitus DSM 16100 = ATCC BAA-896]|uniref:Uncharacterized protein n=2 Tax=Asticcacaulis TaxID=76890 RepID=V4PHK9_9CAUL|nr:hypothetical protein ABENE_05885 [Asticcacaulis benevestitus DSM 16100 = ATCC BAA-896]
MLYLGGALVAVWLMTFWKGIKTGRLTAIVIAIGFGILTLVPYVSMYINLVKFGADISVILPSLLSWLGMVEIVWLPLAWLTVIYGNWLYRKRIRLKTSSQVFD